MDIAFDLDTNDGGSWPPPTSVQSLPAQHFTYYPLAMATDPTGELWFAQALDGGLLLVNQSGKQIGPQSFGADPTTVTATSGPAGVCLAWQDTGGNVWVGALSTGAGVLSGTEVFDAAANDAGPGQFVPAIASLPSGNVVAAWQPLQSSGTRVFAVEMASPTGPAPAPTILGGGEGDPLLLPWRSGALAISPVSAATGILQSYPIGAGLPTTLFPSGVYTNTKPSGYVEADGSLLIAVDTQTSIDLYHLPR